MNKRLETANEILNEINKDYNEENTINILKRRGESIIYECIYEIDNSLYKNDIYKITKNIYKIKDKL